MRRHRRPRRSTILPSSLCGPGGFGAPIRRSARERDSGAKIDGRYVTLRQSVTDNDHNIRLLGHYRHYIGYDADGAGSPSGTLEFQADGTAGLVCDTNGDFDFRQDLTLTGAEGSFSNGFLLPVRTAAPTSPVAGEVYYHSTEHRIYAYDGTNWFRTGALA